MTKLLSSYASFREFRYTEDFFDYVSGDVFTAYVEGTPTSAVTHLDAAGGVLQLATGALDNNEVYVRTTKELFLFADDKPMIVQSRLQFTEAATNAANVIFGLMDAVGNGTLLANGGGPKASYSGAVIFKEDGQTLWSVEGSIAGVQTTAQLTAKNSLDGTAKTAGGAGYVDLGIGWMPRTTTQGDLAYYIDNVLAYKITDFVYTGATEMHLFVGVMAGSGTEETLKVDAVGWDCLR